MTFKEQVVTLTLVEIYEGDEKVHEFLAYPKKHKAIIERLKGLFRNERVSVVDGLLVGRP